jgi:hypothetical protein
MGISSSRFRKFSDISLLNIFSFFNFHDSQVGSFDEVTEFLHIPFAALQAFVLVFFCLLFEMYLVFEQ